MKKTVILGVTSGIAAFKTLALIDEFKKEEINVFVVMTKRATQMIPPEEFEKASNHKVFTELFEKEFDYKNILEAREVEHIALADKADVMIIAPATANIIAKLAHGIADDFLTTAALAVTKPIILCPSMNVNMWHNPIVQENIKKLKSLGYIIINPTSGMLACGYEGIGRLAEIQDIKKEALHQLSITATMNGKKIIVTAGGTIEKIDDVRFIANRSSGKMGIAIAEASYERGAEVLLLRAKNTSMPRYHIREKIFTTSEELLTLIKKNINEYDYIYHTAAVSDFKVKNQHPGKLSSNELVTLKLEPQKKIVDLIKKLNPDIKLIAFKAEYESDMNKLKQAAYKKLEQTNADAVVANDISKKDRGFESDTNELMVVLHNGETKHFGLTAKKIIAGQLITFIQQTIP
jgi:phosphopantothenoylcysteine decarboxylase / phosphopantothenate---cysteine ligase